MLHSSFPLYCEPVDTTQPRKCGTCTLWQDDVQTPNGLFHNIRSRCACPLPASIKKSTMYQGYTDANDGEFCHFWHPKSIKEKS